MDNITLIALVILVMWVAVIVYYLFVSNKQKDLIKEVNDLKVTLDESDRLQAEMPTVEEGGSENEGQ